MNIVLAVIVTSWLSGLAMVVSGGIAFIVASVR